MIQGSQHGCDWSGVRVFCRLFEHGLAMSAKENWSKTTKPPQALPPAETEPTETASAAGTNRKATAETTASEAPLTPQQIEELQQKAAKADEHWDRLLRTWADLENFKKRAARERQEAIKFANASLLEKLIPALDNFDMALAAANNAEGHSMESLKTGIAMIYNQLKTALTESGLEEIDATNQPFDPNVHEAVSHQESAAVPD